MTSFFLKKNYIMGYNLENVRNGKRASKMAKCLALQQLFSFKSSYSFQSSDCHKMSLFNDGGLKLSHFDIFDRLFSFPAFVKL